MNDYVYYNNDDHHDAFRFSGQQFTKTFIKVIIKLNIFKKNLYILLKTNRLNKTA